MPPLGMTKAIYDALVADASVLALIGGAAAYNGSPAIFTGEEVPEDANPPYLWTWGDVSDTAMDTKVTRGREVVRDVMCVVAGQESALAIEDLAEAVRTALHRKKITVPGGTVIVAEASGPITLETDRTIQGRIVSVRYLIET